MKSSEFKGERSTGQSLDYRSKTVELTHHDLEQWNVPSNL